MSLSDDLTALWSHTRDPEAIFDFLRQLPRGGSTDPAGDFELQAQIGNIFSNDHESFTRSYTEGLRVHGAESNWPNNLELRIADSSGAPSVAGRPPIRSVPVNAYWIRGRSPRRALVISGVHGSEQSGIEVVQQHLHPALIQGPPPLFTTILIPVLFPGSLEFDRAYRLANRLVRGHNGSNADNGRYVRIRRGRSIILVDPNRNYPPPGSSGDDARRNGLCDPITGRRLRGRLVIDYMLPETAGLVTLIERFRPERIASVHAHRSSTRPGDAQGIFIDPRDYEESLCTVEGSYDDALTANMLDHARRLGLRDENLNPGHALHYSATHPRGTSLGGWAPVAQRGGGRPAATIVTLEVEDYWPTSEDPPGAQQIRRQDIVRIYARTLREVFLELDQPPAFSSRYAGPPFPRGRSVRSTRPRTRAT